MRLDILQPDFSTILARPLFTVRVSAGFPSPADDYIEHALDLNEKLIPHPAATFFVRVSGNSMEGAGIKDGDLLVVDRSLEPKHRSVVIAIVKGEFTLKRLKKENGRVWLMPENPAYTPIELHDGIEAEIWGVVKHAIHEF